MKQVVVTICIIFILTTLVACENKPVRPSETVAKDSLFHAMKEYFPATIALASLGMQKTKKNVEKYNTDHLNTCPVVKGDKEKSKDDFTKYVSLLIKHKIINELPADIKDKEINEAFEIFKSGQFKQDVASSLKAVYLINNKLPVTILADIKKTPAHIVTLENAFLNDSLQTHIPSTNCPKIAIRGLIKNKNVISKECLPLTFDHTIDALFKMDTIALLTASARVFTDPNNRSSRIALIIYARSQGIDVSEDDLNTLHRFLDTNEEEHKFEDITNVGIKKFSDEYRLNDIQAVVRKTDSGNKECSI